MLILAYVNVGFFLFVISSGLFLIAANAESNNLGFLIAGIVVNCLGVVVLFTGIIKMGKKHYNK